MIQGNDKAMRSSTRVSHGSIAMRMFGYLLFTLMCSWMSMQPARAFDVLR